MNRFPINTFSNIETPFYYYDVDILNKTLDNIKANISYAPFKVHYAVKANANDLILKIMKDSGLGVECVSGGEVVASLNAGFLGEDIAFAGVGKTDKEINLALDADIFCFNVESIPELEVINDLAIKKNKIARIALRVNPNVDAYTHHYITTGIIDNKFGTN